MRRADTVCVKVVFHQHDSLGPRIMNIHELADKAKEVLREAMRTGIKLARDPEATPKEKVTALKVVIAVAEIVLDRTDPKLTASHEIRTDMTRVVKELAEVFSAEDAERMLKQVQAKLLPKARAGQIVKRPPGAETCRNHASGVANAAHDSANVFGR